METVLALLLSVHFLRIQAAYQPDPLFSKQKYTQRLKSQERLGP
jgi:hypothetical protein